MDEWESDPSVRAMRKVFEGMEMVLKQILGGMNIAPHDRRIRAWQEKALAVFERSWGVASQMGIRMDERVAPGVYAHCLANIISSEGVEVPAGLLPEQDEVIKILHEVFR